MSVDKQIGKSLNNDVEVVEVFKTANSESLARFVNQLNEQQLHCLNRLAVHRIKQITQNRISAVMNKFAIGDSVWFQSSDNQLVDGTVIRLNKKTVTVASEENIIWNVSPGLLMHLHSPTKAG